MPIICQSDFPLEQVMTSLLPHMTIGREILAKNTQGKLSMRYDFGRYDKKIFGNRKVDIIHFNEITKSYTLVEIKTKKLDLDKTIDDLIKCRNAFVKKEHINSKVGICITTTQRFTKEQELVLKKYDVQIIALKMNQK